MSDPDLTKLDLHSNYPAFKNNNRYSGFFTISGNVGAGVNQLSSTVALDAVPDMTDTIFKGPTDTVFGSDPRPSTGWFKQGYVWVLGNNVPAGYTNYPTPWVITSKISGSNLIITATYVQTFSDTLALTGIACNYRLVDYSVF